MKKLRLLFVFTFLLSISLVYAKPLGEYEFTENNLNFENIAVSQTKTGQSLYELKKINYAENSEYLTTDLVLAFNSTAKSLHQDDLRNYHIKKAAYACQKNQENDGCAFFYKENDGIEILLNDENWLVESEDLGSFSLEFKFKPATLRDSEGIIFSRVSQYNGILNGLEIVISQEKIEARLYNLFQDSAGYRHSVNLISRQKIKEKEWSHYSLSFNRRTGKLAHYLNNEEQEVKFITETGKPAEAVLQPKFLAKDRPIVYLAKNYFGYLDEFRISRQSFRSLQQKSSTANLVYQNPTKDRACRGQITSPVYTLPSTGSCVTSFDWQTLKRKDTFVWIEIRTSDKLFNKNSKIIPWYTIKNGQRNIYLEKESNEYLRGRYFQWRAHLIASPDGKNSPALFDLKMSVAPDLAPTKPQSLEVKEIGSQYVVLRWRKNIDQDFSGYKIYYGRKSGIYDGVITVKNQRKIDNSSNNYSYVELKIDNRLITENKVEQSPQILEFPLLENKELYYFAISAYDNYKEGTIYNHQSKLSSEVTARPFSGSEIKE